MFLIDNNIVQLTKNIVLTISLLLHPLDISLFTPKVMPIAQMLNTLIESQHINSIPG